MIFLDELKNMIMYKKQFHIPINEENKRKGSAVVLVTPNIESSMRTINHKLMINKYHRGYYIERNVAKFINDAVLTENMTKQEAMNILLEQESLNEAINYNTHMKKILYKERLKRSNELFPIYDEVTEECDFIKYTYLNYKRYKGFNIFSDFFFYNELFFKNNLLKNDKGIDLYFEFLTRFINNKDLKEYGYNKKIVVIPVDDWYGAINNDKLHMYNQSINPISVIYRLFKRKDIESIKKVWGGTTFVFMGSNGFFKIDFDKYDEKIAPKFLNFVRRLSDSDYIPDDNDDDSMINASKKSKLYNVIDDIERSSKVKIDNLTGGTTSSRAKLIDKINTAAVSTKTDNESDILLKLDEDIESKKLIRKVMSQSNNSIDKSVARTKRMESLNDKFVNIEIDNVSIFDIINNNNGELPTTKLDIDTINEEWEKLKFINFDSNYSIEEDIIPGFSSLSDINKKYPLAIRDIKKEDTSTTEDYIDTYTIMIEDINGKRYQSKIDIPQFVDGKYLMLMGNKKSIVKQILLLPIVKTSDDEVQVVSNYNKILIKRFGAKSFFSSDMLLKSLKRLENSSNIKLHIGDATKKNAKHGGVPIDYAELASEFVRIETKDTIIYLNQDEIMNKYDNIDTSKGLPIAYSKRDKSITYFNEDLGTDISTYIASLISFSLNGEELKTFNTVKTKSRKYAYSRAKIMNTNMPVIVVLSYSIGLIPVLERAKIDFELTEKRPINPRPSLDIIKFKDAYLSYDMTYETSLLMNGLKEIDTENYDIADLDSKSTYLEWLDIFGERMSADGISNFYELMIDPITEEVLKDYNLPTDYIDVMIYANNLLSDTSKVDHTNMKGRRIRSNEIVSAIAYKVMADAYGEYKRNMNRGKKDAKFSVDQKGVIKKLLELRTVADNSILNAALEAETISAVSYKGPSGLNMERAYGIDKRAFDDTMQNVIAMSTINSSNVGINRQLTIDSNVTGRRGYIKTIDSTDDLNVTKTFTFSEALTPFGPNRDEPTRTAMTYTQNKHGMKVKNSSPLLVSNGSDQALPYYISNTFAYKSKDKGVVLEKTDDYMIIEYVGGIKKDYINLKTTVEKNSSSGFYTPIKLETKLKKGSLVKEGQIVAHDPYSFSGQVGPTDDLSYNVGTLVKVAMINSDDGFEDSSIISESLSEKMASEVIIKKSVILGKNADIYKMVKTGDKIQEGDPLVIIQNSYEEEDVNILLRNLVDDVDVISDLGRKAVKSKITGTVDSIKAYRTVPISDLSPTLKKKVKEIEKPIKDLKVIIKKYDMEYAEKFLDADYELEAKGNLKGVDEGVLLEFYLKYEDKMSVGDKLTYFAAIKGVIRDIFPEGKEPYTSYRPEEKIDSILALGSLQSRMTFSVKIHMVANKAVLELGNQVKDILGIKH